MIELNSGQSNLAIHTIIQLVWEHTAITRAQLSRESGFSRSTITLNVDRLLSEGLLIEQRTGKQKRTTLQINESRGFYVGVEMDAERCHVGLCSIKGTLVCSERFPIDFTTDPDIILNQIETTINTLQSTQKEHMKNILGIGIGLPTPVDYQRKWAVHPAFMPGWHHYPIGQKLTEKYHCPVFVDNEVNTMAYAEAHLKQELRKSDMLFVKLGSGIGAGLIIGGNIYRGNSGMSGNIGHIRYNNRAELCKCGKRGCLEAISGGSALITKAQQLANEGESAFLKQIWEEKGAITLQDVVNAFNDQEPIITSLIQESATAIGSLVGRLVVFFDPKTVVLGGVLCDLGPQYIADIRKAIIKEATPWIMDDFEITLSTYKDSIGVIGAAMLCIREVLENGLML